MSDVAIRVQGLGKRYRIGELQKYRALRDILAEAFHSPFRRLASLFRGGSTGDGGSIHSFIWALRNVSFEVEPGEVVGIIGRNGTGKSTLLKIFSRITEPTEGFAEIRGRVGSLLEVGTGFHPELTGRENIYLNGAILGMKKREIERKFDDIVAFAETQKFIDTPMKYYSSGMYVRLAFAVAAHLEPDILLVDEVLAVGDTAFQQKCLGKMEDVAKGGRTVLFVSHQLNQIRRLCPTCIWLEAGRVRMRGSSGEVVSAYEAETSIVSRTEPGRRDVPTATLDTRFLSWEVVDPRAGKPNLLTTLGECVFKVVVRVARPIRNGHHGIALRNHEGQLMWAWAATNVQLAVGLHELVYTLPTLPLRPGVYHWQVSLYEDGALLDHWYCVPDLIIATEPQTHPSDEWVGVLNVPCGLTIRVSE